MKKYKYKINKYKFKTMTLSNKDIECVKWLNNQLSKEIYDLKVYHKNVISLDYLKEKGYEPGKCSIIEEYEQKELTKEIHEAIKKLSTKQQQVIQKHFFENQSLRNIAAYYGVSHLTIYEILLSSLRKLRKIIQK